VWISAIVSLETFGLATLCFVFHRQNSLNPSRCQRSSRVSGLTRRIAPSWHEASEQHEKRPIAACERGPLDQSCRDDELLTQQRVLGDELLAGAGQV
jgi:hypothetical protein